jgi:hypothetical protein
MQSSAKRIRGKADGHASTSGSDKFIAELKLTEKEANYVQRSLADEHWEVTAFTILNCMKFH